MMKIVYMVLLIAGMVEVASCGIPSSGWSSLVSSDPGYDVKHDAQGNVIVLDTPREWRDFVQATDFAIAREVAGDGHWGTSKNANEAWVSGIKNASKHREHPLKYIDYIIEQRRTAGLPELVGYP